MQLSITINFSHGMRTEYITYKAMYKKNSQVLLSYIEGITYQKQVVQRKSKDERCYLSHWYFKVQTMKNERLVDTGKFQPKAPWNIRGATGNVRTRKKDPWTPHKSYKHHIEKDLKSVPEKAVHSIQHPIQ